MKISIFKKTIIIVAAVFVIAGVSLFAYWMSEINRPDPIEEEITVIIGIGTPTGKGLEVTDVLDDEDLKFVPVDRLGEDSIGDSISSYIFEIKINWKYQSGESDTVGKKGVLVVNFNDFILKDGETIIDLTEAERQLLQDAFLVSFVKDKDGIPLEECLIDPNEEGESQSVFVLLEFAEDISDRDLWQKLVNYKFTVMVSLEVTHVINA